MSIVISAVGSTATIVASNTFPVGFVIDQLADDADPYDFKSLIIAETAMGVNGDLLKWSKANPIQITLNVPPSSNSDESLAILLESNRVGRGKVSAQDSVTLTLAYPDGLIVTLSDGCILEGTPSSSAASAGRLKTKNYVFAFENISSS